VGNVNPFIVKDNDYYLIVMVVNFFDNNMIFVLWKDFLGLLLVECLGGYDIP
jgi:hypothetical protein